MKKSSHLVKVSLSSLHLRLLKCYKFNTKTLPGHLLGMITFKYLENCVALDLNSQFKILMEASQNPEREVSVLDEINHQPRMEWDSLLKSWVMWTYLSLINLHPLTILINDQVLLLSESLLVVLLQIVTIQRCREFNLQKWERAKQLCMQQLIMNFKLTRWLRMRHDLSEGMGPTKTLSNSISWQSHRFPKLQRAN